MSENIDLVIVHILFC